MQASGKYKTRAESINGILVKLKQVAINNNVAIVVLSQLSRSEIPGMRPTLSDFKGTSSLWCDTPLNSAMLDKVILLYREGYYDQSLPNNKTEYHVVVNKSGATGVVCSEGVPYV